MKAGILSPLSIDATATALQINTDDADAPSGHRCDIAQHLRDVPDEEVARAAAEAAS